MSCIQCSAKSHEGKNANTWKKVLWSDVVASSWCGIVKTHLVKKIRAGEEEPNAGHFKRFRS